MYVQCLIFHFKIIIKIKWWKEWCAFFVRSHSSTFQDIFFFCYLFGCWNLKSELKSLTCIDRHTQIKSMFSYCTYSICLWQKDISYRLQAKYTHTVHCASMYVHIHTHSDYPKIREKSSPNLLKPFQIRCFGCVFCVYSYT